MLIKELIDKLRKISEKFAAYKHHDVPEIDQESQETVADLHDLMNKCPSKDEELTVETAGEFMKFLAARWVTIMPDDSYHYHVDTPANKLCVALARELESALGGRPAYSYLFPKLSSIPDSSLAPREFIITDNSLSFIKIMSTLSHYFETGQWVDIVRSELTPLEIHRVKQRFTHYPALAVYQCDNREKLDAYLSQLTELDHMLYRGSLPDLEKNIKLYLFCLLDAYCMQRRKEHDPIFSIFGHSKAAKLDAAGDLIAQLRTQPLIDLPAYLDAHPGALTKDLLGKIVIFARQSAERFAALQGAQKDVTGKEEAVGLGLSHSH